MSAVAVQTPEPEYGLTLGAFLETCDDLSKRTLNILDSNQNNLTAREPLRDPTGLVYPATISPWTSFMTEHDNIWDTVHTTGTGFLQTPMSPCRFVQQYIHQSLTNPVSCKKDVEKFARLAFENNVERLFRTLHDHDKHLKANLRLEKGLVIEDHENFGLRCFPSGMGPVERTMYFYHYFEKQPTVNRPGLSGQVDRFCIHMRDSGRGSAGPYSNIAAMKYEVPHHLRAEQLRLALNGETIYPATDVIGRDIDGSTAKSRYHLTALITDCYSYMIKQGLRYGYICTGQAFVFSRIPRDSPSRIQYHLHIPNEVDRDFAVQPTSGLPRRNYHRTTVGHIFAFLVLALQQQQDEYPWDNTALQSLNVWPKYHHNNPIPIAAAYPNSNPVSNNSYVSNPQQTNNVRQYCTHACLLGVAHGGPIDKTCPNAALHGLTHPSLEQLQNLLYKQLRSTRPEEIGFTRLPNQSTLGSLYRVTVPSLGYTLVAKGVSDKGTPKYNDTNKRPNTWILRYEYRIYDHIHVRPLQGKCIPVCLGILGHDMRRPSGSGTHYLLLSWAGEPYSNHTADHSSLSSTDRKASEMGLLMRIAKSYKLLHKRGVEHGSAMPRIILLDPRTGGTVFIIDFERAVIHDPVESMSPQARRRCVEELENLLRRFVSPPKIGRDGT